ncbi:hypothetical protein VKT23_008221 [Stygiomarasmius scandens]|uniref:CCHC-type domain-containing protein n=1 Tax=Marasmiellus scandens TaxID=2682957 RepID=A0ABR1JHM0_9AGAR
MDGTTTCKDAWINSVRKFQVKSENDTADLKACWMLMACGDKENLDEWLTRDKTIVMSILDMGGQVSRDEIRSHIISKIPKPYCDFICSQMTAYRLAHDRKNMPMQVIYNKLCREYKSRNPVLPDWAKTSEPKASKSSTPSHSKGVALQVENSHSYPHTQNNHSSTKSSDNIPNLDDIKCYNCGGKGHFACKCALPKKKHKGKSSGNWQRDDSRGKGKGKEENKEVKSKSSNPMKSSNQKEKTGQANMVEDIAYAYMAECLSDDELSESSSNVSEDDNSNEDMPSLQPVSDSEDDWSDDEEDEEDEVSKTFRTFLNVPEGPLSSEEEILNHMTSICNQMSAQTDSDRDSVDVLTISSDEVDDFEAHLESLTQGGAVLTNEQVRLLWQVNGGLAAEMAASWLEEKFGFEVWNEESAEYEESKTASNLSSWCEVEDVPDLVLDDDIYLLVTDLTFIPDDGIDVDTLAVPILPQADSN